MRLFSDVSTLVTDPMLRRALVLAERGRGSTSPNPIVGCVIVRDDEVVGEGFHAAAGEPHAEVNALAAAGDAARGATAYVTLEPCNHTGRTGPCTRALLDAGIAEVVIGMRDPNPGVAGGGAAFLEESGIRVRFAEDPTPFRIQNEAWLAWTLDVLPWITAKVAVSLDGRVARIPGSRARISHDGSAAITMRLRAAADAVIVGPSTLLSDDPALTVRDTHDTPAERQPLRVVLGRTTIPSLDAALFHDGLGPVTVMLSSLADTQAIEMLRENDIDVAVYDWEAGLRGALLELGSRGVVRAMVEPGPRLMRALWSEHVLDELVTIHAGGFAGEGAPAMAEDVAEWDGDTLQCRLTALESGTAGGDAVTVWRPREGRGVTIGT